MTIPENILYIQKHINTLEIAYQQKQHSVQLLAVSKGQPASAIREAFHAGIRDFGENYWQETEKKITSLSDLPLHWHFIGPIQSNKARMLAKHMSWIHSIDREKIASLLSQHRPASYAPVNICIQVNLDKEISKSGVKPEELIPLIKSINQLPGLRLRGLMAIPHPCKDEEEQYLSLLRLKYLLQDINQQMNLSLDTLSMGMSDDLAAAIRAGSTLVRIGRAIFGERT
jgi:pyridoxal phosphate enzyme (YggS family)